MIGEVFAYLAGRSAGRAEMCRRRRPGPLTPSDVTAMRMVTVVFLACALVVLIVTLVDQP